MNAKAAPRVLLWIWLAVLASPIAWAVSLVTMFWLTHPVCQGLPRSVLTLTGATCLIVALAGSAAGWRALCRASPRSVENSGDVPVFLFRLAFWNGLIFALVILLSLIPGSMLTPCPV